MNKYETIVKKGFKDGQDKDTIIQYLFQVGIPFGELSAKFKDLTISLGLVKTKEEIEVIIKKECDKFDSLSLDYTQAMAQIKSINKVLGEDHTTLIKKQWETFPKKVVEEYQGKHKIVADLLFENPKLSMQELKDAKINAITSKGGYDLDIIKGIRFAQKLMANGVDITTIFKG